MLKYLKKMLLVLPLLAAICAEAKITVLVKVNNQTSDTLTVYIESSDNVASTNVTSLFTKMLLPGASITQNVDLEKHSLITGYAILKQGGKTAPQYRIMSKNSEQFTYNVRLDNIDKKQLTDLTNAETMLQYNPTNFLDTDITPKPLPSLFANYLGGLVGFVPAVGAVKSKIVTSISPSDLGTIMSTSTASIGTGQNSKEIHFSNQLTQDIKANVPLAGQLGIVWNNSSLYSVKMEYRDLGVIDWINKQGNKDIYRAFADLNQIIHYNLGFAKVTNPTMVLKQINQAYVFDAIFIEVKQGSQISGDNTVDGSTFFTNNGNFKISNSAVDKKVYGSSYLGYWCNNVAADLTGYLNYSVAVYYKVENSALMAKSETEALAEYQKLRSKNPTLPNLTDKAAIHQYFQSKVQEFITLEPAKATDRNLIVTAVAPTDPLNSNSDEVVASKYLQLLNSPNSKIEVNDINMDAAKILIKKSQQ